MRKTKRETTNNFLSDLYEDMLDIWKSMVRQDALRGEEALGFDGNGLYSLMKHANVKADSEEDLRFQCEVIVLAIDLDNNGVIDFQEFMFALDTYRTERASMLQRKAMITTSLIWMSYRNSASSHSEILFRSNWAPQPPKAGQQRGNALPNNQDARLPILPPIFIRPGARPPHDPRPVGNLEIQEF